ncbi:MAG: DUF2335 domain-containing protein, partial [Gemmatimonadales bacterium]
GGPSKSGSLVAVEGQFFSGPLPHPDDLAKYEQAIPGSGERIIRMAESQATHRQELEKKVVGSNVFGERLGQVFGFVISLVAIAAGWDLIRAGKDTIGLTTILSTIVGLVSVFIVGRRKRDKELQRKDKANP